MPLLALLLSSYVQTFRHNIQICPTTTSSLIRLTNNHDNIDMSSCGTSESGLQVGSSYQDTNSNSNVITNKDFQAELFAILTVYFVQGALGLARLATTFFMKDELHLSPAEIAALTGLTTLPWLIKPVYGFLSDGIPLFGYRRRSYLIISGILGSLSWLALATCATTSLRALAFSIIGSAAVAVSDVVVDSIVVEKSRDLAISRAPQNEVDLLSGESSLILKQEIISGEIQSLCWAAAAVGGIVSAYFSGFLLEIVSPKVVFMITAVFPLLVSAIACFIKEDRIDVSNNVIQFKEQISVQLSELTKTFLNPSIYLPVLFVFIWRATPSPDSAMFFFNTNDLGFKPEFLGRVSLVSNVASLLGIISYRTWLKNVPVKDLIFWCTIISVPLSLSQLLLVSHLNRQIGIPDQAFVLTDSVVLTVLGQISFMPTLVLASNLCPPGVEGALFASLMSVYNGAGTLSSELGAALTSLLGVTDSNFDNLGLLLTLCTFISCFPLPFIGLLDSVPKRDE